MTGKNAAKLLIDKKITVSAAESCTAGLFCATLAQYSGVSEIFSEGIVTYSNAAKEKYLKVKHETLEKYGAVSKQTAVEMAVGIKNASKSDIGIGITGIAGPTGGTAEKPVGTVYIGIAADNRVGYKLLRLGGDRQKVREDTVSAVFDELEKILTDSKYSLDEL